MARKGFSERQFFVSVAGAIVAFCVIVSVAALLTAAPWGGAGEEVREALPEAQGQTTSSTGAKGM